MPGSLALGCATEQPVGLGLRFALHHDLGKVSFQLATYQSSGGRFSLRKGDDEILLYFLSAKTSQPQLQNGNITSSLQINDFWLLKEREKLLLKKIN